MATAEMVNGEAVEINEAQACAVVAGPVVDASADADRERLAAIDAAAVNVRVAECEYEDAKLEAKEKKAAWEAAVGRLMSTISANRDLPLLDHAEKQAAAEQKPDDSWREASIAELGLKPGQVKKLNEAGVETIGQLEDLRAKIADGKAEWPKGIGPAAVTDIEDAQIKWLSEHAHKAALAEAAATKPWDEMSEDEARQFISTCVAEIRKGDLSPPSVHRACYEAGFAAHGDGAVIESVAWLPGTEQDAWLRGWLAAELAASIE